MSGQDDVSHARMVAHLLLPSCVISLNELYRGKLVNSIIVNIPYLLALTLSIISSNIFTRLAICNCLSFILRWGDMTSLLMTIFSPPELKPQDELL